MSDDSKKDILKDLLVKAKADVDKNNLIELDEMARVLGYTTQDVSAALSSRFADKADSKTAGAIFRYGALVGWYAAIAKAPALEWKKLPWWKRFGRM